ncbi:MAG: AAA family ATPase [Candidatus Sungbacteria bacterium]|uniref:AAA family ATPase n=1 Tax=Candidatus Sungiibacteriota bacterium TaxID=2750080 RepID=A0A932VSH3_9BACT|nr:AAA family ATPase [Candidatus Sungbacteria bacterium]
MVRKKRILAAKERAAQDAFMAKLQIKKRKTQDPVIAAIIGLVGSGKSSVARELAGYIGATVIEGDEIRIELGRQGAAYERTWAIAENAAVEVVKQGGNVILDSDFVDEKKRASVREKARMAGIRLVFIRTVCDFDVMSQRIRQNDPGEFFKRASSSSTAQDKGKDVKMRELLRRLPHHYRHVNEHGGKWVLKKFPFAIFAQIDTTDSRAWKREMEKCARKLFG